MLDDNQVPAKVVPIAGAIAVRFIAYGLYPHILLATGRDETEVLFLLASSKEEIGKIKESIFVKDLGGAESIDQTSAYSRHTRTIFLLSEMGWIDTREAMRDSPNQISTECPTSTRRIPVSSCDSVELIKAGELGHQSIVGFTRDGRRLLFLLDNEVAFQNGIELTRCESSIPKCRDINPNTRLRNDDPCQNRSKKRKWLLVDDELGGPPVWCSTGSCLKCP